MCILKKDLCPNLLAGHVVDDIVVYSDGMMEVFLGMFKYRFQLSLLVQTHQLNVNYSLI